MADSTWGTDRNLTMLMDFYELTMSNGFFSKGMQDQIVVFDMFFRKIPDGGGYAIFAGLQQVIDYIENLHFSHRDIDFLKNKNIFCEEFLDYLSKFSFECDIWSIKEGTPIFPNEPIVTVRGPIIQGLLLETMLLLTINHQSLIATKASRIVNAAEGRAILEFGARRAHGYDAAVYGARAAYISGCVATSNTLLDIDFDVPASGTMAHSWVQLFDNEYEAFKAYAEVYPNKCTLLIDTYNTLKSGLPNAIKVFNDIIKPLGTRPSGVRIDSGDIAYISKKCREMLDEAGYEDVKIIASNSLDEYIIADLLRQDAKVDIFGVGEKLITSKTEPVFGGVYKLVAVKKDEKYEPRIKISETVEKITTPDFKKLYRVFSKTDGHAIADYITCNDENIDTNRPLLLFDPNAVWKRQLIEDFFVEELQVQIYSKGRLVYLPPTLKEVQQHCKDQLETIWDEIKRFENPHKFYVDMSEKLWGIKQDLLIKMSVDE